MGIPLTLSSVPAATPYIQYIATNGQTLFPYPFVITQDSDLVVVVNGVTQPTDSGYTLSGQGNSTGGNVMFTVGQTAGAIITLYRNIVIQRITQISQNSGFSSTAFNAEYNNIYLILQQLQEAIGFSLQIPNTNNPAPTTTLTPAAYANKYLSFDGSGNPQPALLTSSGTVTGALILSLLTASGVATLLNGGASASLLATLIGTPQTAIELARGVVPTDTTYLPGDWRRYGVKGGGGRASDVVITAGSAIVTSPSGQFAKAVAGMKVVVIDGGASRTGGRPAPLITTILSVQSANQITLNATVTQPGTIVFTGTLGSSGFITSPSINPITAGVGLTRIWTASGANIPVGDTIKLISATALQLSTVDTGSGVATITLTAPITVAFGWDDGAAIVTATSLPYPLQTQVDTFLSTLPLTLGGINSGCSDFVMPKGALLLFALTGNTQHCVTAAGFDQNTLGAEPYQNGMRFKQFGLDIAYDCCNTGLDGFSIGQSYFSRMRVRCENPFRNMLSEWFTTNNTWQESNIIDISGSNVGLHFQHKVNLGNVFQTQGHYRVLGRACGLNSVYLGINATTQKDQLGGGLRMYAGGNSSVADGGISQNQWGMLGGCELDGERATALSFGSDICNSVVTFVDASANYIIEGNAQAHFSNTYRSNFFGSMVNEDISQGSDARGGYQYYAMPNVTLNDTTVLSTSAGPWGQTAYNAAVWSVAGTDNWIRNTNNIMFSGSLSIAQGIGMSGNSPVSAQAGWGTPTAGAVVANYNGASATLVQTSNALSSVLTQLKLLGLLAT